jgi:hypothetical protein
VLAFIPKWRITAVHLVLSRHAKHFARLANKGRAQLKGDSKMTHYVATVHLLFELDESMHDEMDIPDALNSILTENMRKYSRADSCLIDWTFGSNGHAADSIETVMLPDGYEPDETPFPHPVDPIRNAAPAMLAALKALFKECAMTHKHWGEGSNTKEAQAAIEAAQAAIEAAGGREELEGRSNG